MEEKGHKSVGHFEENFDKQSITVSTSQGQMSSNAPADVTICGDSALYFAKEPVNMKADIKYLTSSLADKLLDGKNLLDENKHCSSGVFHTYNIA